jgi:pimeloyl-ACP methyl ester carboxylesterase
MPIALHTEVVTAAGATPERLALVLHGVFGSAANWRMFMRALVKERPDWGFVLCDLRGHARSQGASAPHDLQAMADDLVRTAEDLPLPVAGVIGHSLGGKVALTYAAREPAALEQVWVLDSQPGARPFSGMTVDVLELLERLPRVFADRKDFVDAVVAAGQPKPIAAWLAMNVRRDGDELVLHLDLPAIRSILEDFYRTDVWSMLAGNVRTQVVVATRSFIWGEGDVARLSDLASNRPTLKVHRLEGAGHFVNVDAPDALRALFVAHL